jgi:hypothetical protein
MWGHGSAVSSGIPLVCPSVLYFLAPWEARDYATNAANRLRRAVRFIPMAPQTKSMMSSR